MIEFDDQFGVPAPADEVMRRLADVEAVSRCVPGATLQSKDADGFHEGTMAVRFGPKTVRFKGRLRCEFDLAQRAGVLSGGGSTSGGTTSIKVRTEFRVHPAPDDPGSSIVAVSSRSDVQGALAQFAAAGGALIARPILEEFAVRLAAQLESEGGRASCTEGAAGSSAPEQTAAAPLSGAGLLGRAIAGSWRRLKRPR